MPRSSPPRTRGCRRKKASHDSIRGITEALHALNSRMAKWVDEETEFTAEEVPLRGDLARRLADQLLALDLHLMVWLQKYARSIPGRPENTVVFLADELKEGVGFPQGIEETVRDAIVALGGNRRRGA